jgi:hypothetical protein
MNEKHLYQPLTLDDGTTIDDVYPQRKVKQAQLILKLGPGSSVLLFLLVLSFTTNLIQAWNQSTNTKIANLSTTVVCFPSVYFTMSAAEKAGTAKLAHNVNVQWVPRPDEQDQEVLLGAISLDDGAIAVTKTWADQNGLGETSVFP